MTLSSRADAVAAAARGELLGPAEMMAIFQVKKSRFYALLQEGAFDPFKVKPAIGPRIYSGVLVHRYLQGQPLYVPTFGRRKAS